MFYHRLLSEILIAHFLSFQFQFVSGEWSSWNAWSVCFEESGISAQTRTRACIGDPVTCAGSDNQARACLPADSAVPNYSPVLGKKANTNTLSGKSSPLVRAQADWSLWSEWTECQSIPQGNLAAFRSRWRVCDRRKCDVVGTIDGLTTKVECSPCSGSPVEQQSCSMPFFTEHHESGDKHNLECQLSEWSQWSLCSATCGTGTRIRSRSCPCEKCVSGDVREEQPCYNLVPCTMTQFAPPPPPPPPSIVAWDEFGWNSNRSFAIVPGFNINPCNYCPPMYPLPCYTCLNLQLQG